MRPELRVRLDALREASDLALAGRPVQMTGQFGLGHLTANLTYDGEAWVVTTNCPGLPGQEEFRRVEAAAAAFTTAVECVVVESSRKSF